MLAFGKKAILPLLLSATANSVALAQQKECEVDEGKPSEVARAMLALQVAQSSTKPEEVAKQLKSAVGLLEKADKTRNPVGQNFVLGKTLVLWMSQPNVTIVTTRGALGYAQNPTASIDFVTAIDSAFTVVEKAMPECVGQTSAWRGQKGWVTMINDAIQQLQAEHADSAEALAKRSLVLNKTSPYGFMVLGNVAQKRNQPRQAIDYYRQTVTAAGTDTSYADVKRQILLAAGNMAAEASESANGSEKSAYDTDAKWAFEALLADSKDPKASSFADAARSGLARLASASGDTASVRATYAEQLANPSGFSFQQLLSSGVTAARAKQTPDAIKLFEAAYKKNPYHRDVLYNLALMYLNGNQTEKVVPMVRELVAVDPSNGDNFRLFTFAFANIQKTHNEQIKKYNDLKKNAKTPRAQKAYDDSARTFFELAKPMTDSALKYNALADAFPMKVTFSEFTSAEDKTTLGGSIANNTDASQTYTLKVDFLDMSGKVITSQTATVGPVSGGQAGRFSVQGTGAGIAAFKYAPLVDPNTVKPKSSH
jgi:tetratricopeptide (TPR) repeat protein